MEIAGVGRVVDAGIIVAAVVAVGVVVAPVLWMLLGPRRSLLFSIDGWGDGTSKEDLFLLSL